MSYHKIHARTCQRHTCLALPASPSQLIKEIYVGEPCRRRTLAFQHELGHRFWTSPESTIFPILNRAIAVRLLLIITTNLTTLYCSNSLPGSRIICEEGVLFSRKPANAMLKLQLGFVIGG